MQRHENKKAEHAAWTIPLSENQKRFYFEEQLHAGTGVYHTAGAFEILGALDRQAFRKACRMAFERYAFLRARVDRESLCWQWSASQEDVFDRCYQEVDASQESLDLAVGGLAQHTFLFRGREAMGLAVVPTLPRQTHLWYVATSHGDGRVELAHFSWLHFHLLQLVL